MEKLVNQMRRSPVNQEVKMLRNYVGIIDISNFANYFVSGEGAHNWLESVFANYIPKSVGKSCLTPLIGVKGGIAGDFVVTKLDQERFMIIGSGIAEGYHQRFFSKVKIPKNTKFENLSEKMTGFNIAGPKSRDLLQSICSLDFSNKTWPFMNSRIININNIECVALRVSFTGDLGWELHCKQEHQLPLYNLLLNAGKKFNGGAVGSRAQSSLRIEKGYGSWGREYSPEYWPQEAGLDKLIKLNKDFLNKDAYLKISNLAPKFKLNMFEIEIQEDADANGGEPIFTTNNKPIGHVTSGAYGGYVEKSLAIGYIKNGAIKTGEKVIIYILGKPHKAKILSLPSFDPEGIRLYC